MPHKIQPPTSIGESRRWPLSLVVGFFISVCIFALTYIGILTPITAVFGKIYQPVLPLQYFFTEQLSRPWKWAQFIRHGTSQIDALEQQLAERTTQIAKAESLQQENEDLRAQLSSMSTVNVQDQQIVLSVPARVVTAAGIFGIDQGTAAGIQQGDVVFSRGYVIGRVVKVGDFFSEFGLTAQGNSPVLVKTNTGVTGFLTGKDNVLQLKEVAVGQKVQTGDRLYTVGSVDDHIPPGLIAGEIKEISHSAQSSTNEIIVSQPGNPFLPSLVVVQRFGKK